MNTKILIMCMFIGMFLSSELWGVYCEDLGGQWLRFHHTALYQYPYITQKHPGGHFTNMVLT